MLQSSWHFTVTFP
jgi:hypothetical protein